MNNFLGRSLWGLVYAVVLGAAIHTGDDRERGELEGSQRRYTPYINPCLLPVCLLTLVIAYLVMDLLTDWTLAPPITAASSFFLITLHIGLYFIVLMPLMPFFRRRFSARTCAMLWLLPNYLYITLYSFMEVSEPLLVIPVSLTIQSLIAVIWAIGFTAVLGWHLISHLRFRRILLQDAVEVTDPAILELWQKELEFAGLQKKKYRLVRSPATQTPLSIGFFQRSIRVVLPQRHYTPEELALVLRHEIIHIGREDSGTKFFLVFCTALCWFNPLMWKAMRRSADDLELSCDETVLLEADDATRRQYADLLLRTAGDERGFTTCLSASAQALRYRLENVLHPRKRWAGGLAIIVVFYVLIMSCGYVAMGYDQVTGRELIFAGQDPTSVTIEEVSRLGDSSGTDLDWLYYNYNCTDEEKLTQYISQLNFCKVTGNYSFSDENWGVSVRYATPVGKRTLRLDGNALILWTQGESSERIAYFCTEKLDWDLLHSLIVPQPRLDVTLTEPNVQYHFAHDLSPHAHILSTTVDGVTTRYPPADPEKTTRMLSSAPHYTSAALSFTHELYDGTFEVQVENWRRTQSYTVKSSELEMPFVLELPPYYAHYTVRATIVDDKGVIYDTEYRFDLGPLDDSSITAPAE